MKGNKERRDRGREVEGKEERKVIRKVERWVAR